MIEATAGVDPSAVRGRAPRPPPGQRARSSAAYSVRPGPNASATTCPPGSGRPAARSAPAPAAPSPTSSCRGRAAPSRDASSASGRQVEVLARPSRMRGPPGCTAQPSTSPTCEPVAASSSSTSRADVPGQHVGDPRRQPHPEAEVGDVPGHVVGRAARRCGRRRRRPRARAARPELGSTTTAAAASANSACATTWSTVVGRRLHVQAGQLQAEQHRRAAPARPRSRPTAPSPGSAA